MCVMTGIFALVATSGCHAHKADAVVVVKKPHKTKVIWVDNDHKRKDYRIVYVKPKKKSICKKTQEAQVLYLTLF